MAVYRFVGLTESGLHDTPYKFTQFGQAVEIAAELAESAIAEGALLLPASEWAKVGIGDAELKAHATKLAVLKQIPSELEPKVRAAWAALHDYRVKGAAALTEDVTAGKE